MCHFPNVIVNCASIVVEGLVLSAVLLTLNEEKNIRECLESVRPFADELLVLDSGSSDHTVVWAKEAGARVTTRRFDNYPSQRNAALEEVRGDWIFFIDADERADAAVGEEICREISRIQNAMSDEVLFWIPRKNYIFGKWIQHTGWSPDYQPRVLKKGKAWFDPSRSVHELVVAQGGELYLKQPLIHYNYTTLAEFRARQERYTKFEAQEWYAAGKRARLRGYIGQPIREFVRRFIKLHGYRDGLYGLWLSTLMGYYAFKRQLYLAQLQKS